MIDIPARQIHGVPRIRGPKCRDKRPCFDALHKDASRRQFDIVIAWSVDRLGRSPCTNRASTTTPEGGASAPLFVCSKQAAAT
jgi:hypothetical protein